MPEVPFRPLTPHTPNPSAGAPIVPLAPPPLPSVPQTPPVVQPAPTLPPPAPTPPPIPPVEPIKKNPHPHHIFTGLFVLLCALGLIGILILVFYPKLQQMIPRRAPPKIETIIPESTSTAQITTMEVTTSTTPEPTGCVGSDGVTGHYFSERVNLFLNDANAFCENGQHLGTFVVTATAFGDSRCKPGMQCIWAGEQTVTLESKENGTKAPIQTIILGTMRARSGKLFGHMITLHEIDDGKGGTYANVTVQ